MRTKEEFQYLKKGNQYFPLIDIEILHGKRKLKIKALVDSGASFSVFRSEIADYLKIPIEKGNLLYLTGIGGRILGYLHKLSIKVGNKVFSCKVVFSKEYTVSFNILGRDNFFVPFLITFNERAKKIFLEEN